MPEQRKFTWQDVQAAEGDQEQSSAQAWTERFFAPATGTGKFKESTFEMVGAGSDFVGRKTGIDYLRNSKWKPKRIESEDMAAELGSSATSLVWAYLSLGRAGFPKANFGTAAGGSRLANVMARFGNYSINALGKGAAADTLAFSSAEARFSDMFTDSALANPVTDYLASDPNDTLAEAKFKTAVEGMGLGAAVDFLLKGAKVARKLVVSDKMTPEKQLEEWISKAEGLTDEEIEDLKNVFEVNSRLGEYKKFEWTQTPTKQSDEVLEEGAEEVLEETADTTLRKTTDDVLKNDRQVVNVSKKVSEEEMLEMAAQDVQATKKPRKVSKKKQQKEAPKKETKKSAPDIPAEASRIFKDTFDEFRAQFTDGKEIPKDLLEDIGLAARVNFSKIANQQDPMMVSAAIGKAFQEHFTLKSGGTTQTWDQVREAGESMLHDFAKDTGTDVEMARKIAESIGGGDLAPGIYALKSQASYHMKRLAANVHLMEHADTMTEFEEMLVDAFEVTFMAGDKLTQAARALAIGRMEVDGKGFKFIEEVRAERAEMREAARAEAKKLLKREKNAVRIFISQAKDNPMKAVRELKNAKQRNLTKMQKIQGVIAEGFVGNLLKSPAGILNDFISTGVNANIIRPLETMMGGALLRDKEAVAHGFRQMYAIKDTYKVAWDMAMLTLKYEDSFVTGNSSVDFNRFYIDSETLGIKNDHWAKLVDMTGQFARAGLRLRMAGDEFYQNLASRGYLYAKHSQEAVDQGLKGIEFRQYVKSRMDEAFEQIPLKMDEEGNVLQAGQRLRDDQAKAWARKATFTTPLADQAGAGKALISNYQKFVDKHPLMRAFVTPFVQTPTNLLYDGFERLPAVGLLSKTFRQELTSADPIVKGQAWGKLSMSYGASVFFYFGVLNGTITGGGPANTSKRRNLMNSQNWQPYSIRLPNGRYISYRRAEPFSTLIGTMADVMENYQNAVAESPTYGENDPVVDDAWRRFSAATLVLADQLKNKSFLQGLGNIMKSVEEFTNEDRADLNGNWVTDSYFARSLVRSAIPIELKIMRDIEGNPAIMEIRNAGDAFKASMPDIVTNNSFMRQFGINPSSPRFNVLSEDMEYKEGAFGLMVLDRMNPLMTSRRANDKVLLAMHKLNTSFEPAQPQVGRLNLLDFETEDGENMYDKYNELIRTHKIDGLTLRESLEDVIDSEAFKELGTSDPFLNQEMRGIISKVIQQYRKEAKILLIRDHDELWAEYEKVKTMDERSNPDKKTIQLVESSDITDN